MDILGPLFTVIAFFSLMYGVISIDAYFQNSRSAYKFLTQEKNFSLESIKILDKELGK